MNTPNQDKPVAILRQSLLAAADALEPLEHLEDGTLDYDYFERVTTPPEGSLQSMLDHIAEQARLLTRTKGKA